MLRKIFARTVGTVLASVLLWPAAALACSRTSVSGSDATIGARAGMDAVLLDQAILVELNLRRCQNGLGPLRSSANLRSVALNHAKWMARNTTVSHQSSVPGQSTLSARMSSSGVDFTTGAENIGMVHRFQLDGQSFKIRDGASCAFATYGGKPISAHSYASLARYAVDLWMASSGHRRNILNPRVSIVGSAAALNSDTQYCGQVYLTQDFAG